MTEFSKNDLKAIDELIHEVESYRRGKDFTDLIDFISRFPQIAPFNAMLVHIQKPGSQLVASASEWKEKYNRTIKPGARPLVILWPFSPVRFVFELGDTAGNEPFPDELVNPFRSAGAVAENKFKRLLDNLIKYGISYTEADYGTSMAGKIHTTEQKTTVFINKKEESVRIYYQLIVNKGLPREDKFATIIHELGHLFCGHLGSFSHNLWPDRRNKSKEIEEFEAETVAWLVCSRAGLKIPSAKYLSKYLNSENSIPEISLESVIKATGIVETMMQRALTYRKELMLKDA